VNRILGSILLITILLSGCAAPATQGVEARDGWMRPAAQGGNGAVYLVVRSASADEITSVSSDVAEAVEMHQSTMSGDVMEMHPLHSVELEAGKDVTFEPGGLHIMLIGLKQDINPGDETQITLHFRNAPDLPVSVAVQENQP